MYAKPTQGRIMRWISNCIQDKSNTFLANVGCHKKPKPLLPYKHLNGKVYKSSSRCIMHQQHRFTRQHSLGVYFATQNFLSYSESHCHLYVKLAFQQIKRDGNNSTENEKISSNGHMVGDWNAGSLFSIATLCKKHT